MSQYIEKSVLVAEIERRKEESWLWHYTKEKGIVFDITDDILSFINTLEVKEVDDEPGCKIFPRPIECYSTCKECPFANNKY